MTMEIESRKVVVMSDSFEYIITKSDIAMIDVSEDIGRDSKFLRVSKVKSRLRTNRTMMVCRVSEI